MKKIIGIFIVTLMIATAVLPAVGTMNYVNDLNVSSAVSTVEWSMTYGGSEYERIYCVHETDDGGYIGCGETEIDDNFLPWVLKVDSQGNIEWEWTLTEIQDYEGHYFNHFEDTHCFFIQQTSDGGYILCFQSKCWISIGGGDYYPYWIGGLVKFDGYGTEEWVGFYNDAFEWGFIPTSFIELNDGGFIVTGVAGDPDPAVLDLDAGLMKIDAMGVEQWYKEYRYGDGDDQAYAICATNDNGYLITGFAQVDTNYDYWMIKTDSNGEKEWGKTYGGDQIDLGHPRNCFQTNDGGFIMCGYSYSYGAGRCDLWIVKTDSMGDIEWDKTYGGSSSDICWSMEATDDGFVFCVSEGYDRSSGDKSDIHLVKTDDNGNIIWIQEYGGEGIQIGQYVDKTSDGGFIVSGRTGGYLSTKSDGLLVKFAPFENQRPNKPDAPDGPAKGKPDTEYTFTASATDPDGDSLQYMWDWGDGNFSDWLDTNEATYTWTYADNFEVRVMAIDEHGGESDWSDSLAFSTPKNKPYINTPLLQFLEKHPNLFPILQQILGL